MCPATPYSCAANTFNHVEKHLLGRSTIPLASKTTSSIQVNVWRGEGLGDLVTCDDVR